MHINDDHMYHGAALTQIAEHDRFTAINSIRLDDGRPSRSAFLINAGIVIYLKYATRLSIQGDDYIFTFNQGQKDELRHLNSSYRNSVFIALICVDERHICCISYDEFRRWLRKRRAALRDTNRDEFEENSTILVQLQPRQQFQVNMNLPGSRGRYLDEEQRVPRNRFPNVLFEQ